MVCSKIFFYVTRGKVITAIIYKNYQLNLHNNFLKLLIESIKLKSLIIIFKKFVTIAQSLFAIIKIWGEFLAVITFWFVKAGAVYKLLHDNNNNENQRTV